MVVVGLTLVEPLAAVEVKVPGTMEIFVAPVVSQLSVLLCPRMMLVGLALKELIVGFVAARAAAPPSATQAVKISAINTVLAHSSAAVPRCTVSNRAVLCSTVSNRAALRSAVSNRPFPARSIFIFRLGLAYAPPGLATPRPASVAGTGISRILLAPIFNAKLTDFDSSASAPGQSRRLRHSEAGRGRTQSTTISRRTGQVAATKGKPRQNQMRGLQLWWRKCTAAQT